MPTIKLTLEYDGGAYAGWQCQPNAPSVQSALEAGLARLTGENIRARGAGRTDAGVHARGQVAAFTTNVDIPIERFARALNTRLPADIAAVRAEPVPFDFDPRRHCLKKQYVYTFLSGDIREALGRGRAWQVKWPLDIKKMQTAAGYFLGTHDFTSFANQERAGEDNLRTVERSEVIALPPDRFGRKYLLFVVEGRSFLYNMVRTLAGTLVDVGAGRFSPEELPEIMARKNRAAAGQGAPPWGLCLEWVIYPGEEKPPDNFLPLPDYR